MVKTLNKKGFTLIELLAVVVILGILMLVAVPSVNHYIYRSRVDSYIRTLNSLAEAVRYDVVSGKYTIKVGEEIKVPFSSIKLEREMEESPFGKFNNDYSYVIVIKNENSIYTYKIQALDSKGYYVNIIDIQELSREDILLAEIKNGVVNIPDTLKKL